MMQTALVIGYGSIGTRHARILREMGLRVAVVSRRGEGGGEVYADIETALRGAAPEYVVVANETSRHLDALDELAAQGFTGAVLVEKPLSIHADAMRHYPFRVVRIAYNLRFHPALRALASRLAGDRVISVQAYVGQYLPDWRPGTDYRVSYSAKMAAGGGVLRDLSHELDYLAWLFGSWVRLVALGGRRGDLDIDSDDCWGILMETDRGTLLTLQLNYLDRVARRELIIVGAVHAYRLDLVAGRLEVDGVPEDFRIERDATYRQQHRAVLDGRWDEMCSLEDGMAVMATIEAVEQSAGQGRWVTR